MLIGASAVLVVLGARRGGEELPADGQQVEASMTSADPWIANLGMYDPLWLQAANDALWAAIRTRLGVHGYSGMSDDLDRARPLAAIWHDPRLLVGQTCGYPLMTQLGAAVTVIGTPVYDLPGCDGTQPLQLRHRRGRRALQRLSMICGAARGAER